MKKVLLFKILLLSFSLLFSHFAIGQKSDFDNKESGKRPIKDVSKSNYTSLKKQGALSENYEYRIDNGKVISFNPAARAYSPTNSTLTPCDKLPVQGPVGYTVQVDDSPLLNIPIPFNFCFYGTNYTSLKLSPNGNVQFSSNSTSFSSTGFPSTAVNMIAPFWADGESMVLSGGLKYGKIHIDAHPTYMIISWDSMGYYSSHVDKLNSFQLVLTNGLDPILPPGKNVGFYYKKMQWTTGDASSGTNGFPTTQPGTPATIGANQGNGVDYFLIGRFGVPGSVYDGPLGNSDGISWLDGKRFFFDVCPAIGSNQAPTPTLIGPCDTIKLCGNDSLIIKNAFIGPELTQTVSISANAATLGTSFSYSVLQTGNNTDISMFIDGNTAPAGYHIVTMNATDNGVPSKTSSQSFVVFVDHASVNNLNGQIIFTPTIGVCPGGSATASVSVSGGIPSSYLWNNNASTSSTSFTITPALDSTVYVTIKSGQCRKTITNYIRVNPVPVAGISGVLSLCSGTSSTTVLTASNTLNFAAQAPYTYSWSGSPTAPSPTNSQTTTATGGNYSVIITNKYNCTSSAAVTVTLNMTPVFTVVPTNTTVCLGTNIQMSINFNTSPPTSCGLAKTGCFSASTRTVGTGTSTNGNTSFPTPYSNYYKSSRFQMLFKASELTSAGIVAGKISSITFNISSLNSFSVALKNYTIKMKCTSVTNMTSTFDDTGLSQVYFTNSYMPTSGTNTHNYNQAYEWDGSSNILVDICYDRYTTPSTYVSNGSASAFYTTTAFTSVTHDESDSQDLCGSSNFPSTSSNRPNIRFGNCLSTPTVSDFTYSWSPVTGLSNPTIANPIANLSSSIQYSVVVTPTAAATCSNVSTTSLTVNSVVQPTVSAAGPFCDNFAPQQMTASPAGGVWSAASVATSVSAGGQFSPNSSLLGNNKLYYTLTNAPCVKKDSVLVNVVQFIPATLTGTLGPYCIYDPTVNLQALAQYTGGVWSGNGVSTSSFTPSAAGAATSIITYSTDPIPNGLCPDSKSISILVTAKPEANAIPSNLGGCNYPWQVNFSTTTVNTGVASWNFGDGSANGNGLNVSHVYTTPGIYFATITYTDNAGCKDTSQTVGAVTIYSVPVVAFEPSLDETTIINSQIVFTNQTSNLPNNMYTWNFGNSTSSTDVSPTYLFTNIGEYTVSLIAVSPDGCQDTAVKKIIINPEVVIYVPNAFTPGNNDGLNDVFQIFLPPTGVDYSTFSLLIYDRWGELVYTTNDVNESWNGAKHNSGAVLKQEVFVWKITFKDQKKKFYEKRGHVSLLHK